MDRENKTVELPLLGLTRPGAVSRLLGYRTIGGRASLGDLRFDKMTRRIAENARNRPLTAQRFAPASEGAELAKNDRPSTSN